VSVPIPDFLISPAAWYWGPPSHLFCSPRPTYGVELTLFGFAVAFSVSSNERLDTPVHSNGSSQGGTKVSHPAVNGSRKGGDWRLIWPIFLVGEEEVQEGGEQTDRQVSSECRSRQKEVEGVNRWDLGFYYLCGVLREPVSPTPPTINGQLSGERRSWAVLECPPWAKVGRKGFTPVPPSLLVCGWRLSMGGFKGAVISKASKTVAARGKTKR